MSGLRTKKAAVLGALIGLLFPAAARGQAPPDAPASDPQRPPSQPEPERPASSAKVVTFGEAVQSATRRQPLLRQAKAATGAGRGRVEQARSGYLPQITGTGLYQRTTGNFAPRPGATAGSQAAPSATFNTFNYFTFGVTASQLIYDFGQTSGRWKAAEAVVDALQASERTTENQVLLGVSSTYFAARAQQALVHVADETVANQNKHLAQIAGFVKAGTRPEIDVAQARTDLANARLLLINAQNGYEVAKAQLNQAMGVARDTDYEVADESIPPIEGEDSSLDALVSKALASRPEVTALARQREANELTVRSLKGGYGPVLAATAGATLSGVEVDALVPNANVGLTMTWPLFQGGLTTGQVRESEANLQGVDAQADALRLQVRLEVDQARLAVRSAKASISATEDAASNARERLKLAEGRYGAGVGSIIELGDAQVAFTNAAAQNVQAQFNLATARAQLFTALGRR